MTSRVQITLFDSDPVTGEPKEPLVVSQEYNPEMSLKDQGYKKVAIFAGDDVGGGTVFIPLICLMQCMEALMQRDQQRSSGIIVPKKPGIILN